MFPPPADAAVTIGLRTLAAAVSSAATPLASVADGSFRPLWVAVGALLVTVGVGAVLIAGFPTATRRVSGDAVERPDLSFAAGFVVLFGLLVAVALPMTGATYLGISALDPLAGIVSLPGLLGWAALLLVGGTLGAIVLGDRIAVRLGDDSPSLRRALAIGAVVVCASLLVPVFGALLAMGLATVAIGADARRRFDLERWLGIDDEGNREPTATAAAGSTVDWDARRSSETAVWKTNEDRPSATASERDANATAEVIDRTESDVDGPRKGDRRADEAWTVDDWEWDIGTDADREDETEPEPADDS
ncbi:ABC transporter permease [Haloterrigena alkaliphila]|uniref:ABC transporter permease n=1 Tax=Haloterrigena alkaliphila TaxID=2816475 RepID=A0A8A2V962_9EURY|nr:ABC transporter permease [Haloterrigena alkaliphila]QSW98001.1 ABC transporter permease [Haloterrigena alkaliphila]